MSDSIISVTADPGGGDWPGCTACGRALWQDETDRYACRVCEDRAGDNLRAIAVAFPALNSTAALTPTVRRDAGTPGGSGGRSASPAPVRLDVLSLTAGGGVAARLQAVEDAWRPLLGRRIATWAGSPAQAVPVHVTFLRMNLQWACRTYEDVALDLAEFRRLRVELAAALSPDPRPRRVSIGRCPVVLDDGSACGAPLTVTVGSFRAACRRCGSRWDDPAAWQALCQAQEATA